MIGIVHHGNGDVREITIDGIAYAPEQLERILQTARRWRDAVDASNVNGSISLTHTLTVAALAAEHALLAALSEAEVPS